MTRAIYLQPGDVLGAYRVISVHTTAPEGRDRLYTVESTCCHTEVVRSHKVLIEGRRVGHTQCPRCARQICAEQRLDNRPFAVGDVVGPVTLIALEVPMWRRVRWECCGTEELLSVQRLHQIKHRAKDGFQQLCGECNLKRARTRYMGVLMRATATLPPGIIPAAVAWPRPGVRA
ncbi:MAG: hypothetical protein KAX46_03095 [Chromatiaceae bacterium]|nr:hypothetical protein [Chromatiaceae bacterium]